MMNQIYRYNKHTGILSIKEKISGFHLTFCFNKVDLGKIPSEIKGLDSKKASKSNDITMHFLQFLG